MTLKIFSNLNNSVIQWDLFLGEIHAGWDWSAIWLCLCWCLVVGAQSKNRAALWHFLNTCYNLWRERERGSTFQSLKSGLSKLRSSWACRLMSTWYRYKPSLLYDTLDGLPAVCRPLSAQQGTFIRIAPDGKSQEHLERLVLDCWLFSSGSSHLI